MNFRQLILFIIAAGIVSTEVLAKNVRDAEECILKVISSSLNGVHVSLDHKEISYERSNRNLDYFLSRDGYPPEVLTTMYLKNKKVLDLGTGKGSFVTDLRKLGADAYGIDLVLTPRQRNTSYFLERDARHTGFDDESFDIIFSGYSVFYYHLDNKKFISEVLAEVHRILKSGGVLLISASEGSGLQDVIGELGEKGIYLEIVKSQSQNRYVQILKSKGAS